MIPASTELVYKGEVLQYKEHGDRVLGDGMEVRVPLVRPVRGEMGPAE